jgi:hypothetical protein
MSAAFAAPWPGSRVVLGWWRELLDRQPQQLWFSRLLLHRVEASVRVMRARSLDAWQRALLRILSTRVPCTGGPEQHLTDLQMDRQVLAQFVRELTDVGLLHRNGADHWDLSSMGRQVLQTGSLPIPSEERRTLYFVDNSPFNRPPHFLDLRRPPPPVAAGSLPAAPANARFDVASLEQCIHQSAEWKTRYHFPRDIDAVLLPRADVSEASNWQRVVLDSVGTLLLVLLRTESAAAGKPTVLGFAVRAEGWTLETEPILTLAEGWEDVLPDLASEPSPEAWQHAWQAWCQPRGLPRTEVESCRLERSGHRLLVYAPPSLIERLRTARSDAIKHEAWLLAGDGRTRAAAQIDLQPLEL